MRLCRFSYSVLTSQDEIDSMERFIERCGRVCYKSEDRCKEGSEANFIKHIIDNGHESVLEHKTVSVLLTTNRGVTHEIVRHRIGSYSQESTRYCNYSKDKFGNELSFIIPSHFIGTLLAGYYEFKDGIWHCKTNKTDTQYSMDYDKLPESAEMLLSVYSDIECTYFKMLESGLTAQEARGVLPNDLKTDIVVTYNLREWRHFFKLRCNKAAHPDMVRTSYYLLQWFKENLPNVFADIELPDIS